MNSVLIIGCGEVGRRVAQLSRPNTVVGIVRSRESASRLQQHGVDARTLDLDRAFGGDELPAAGARVFYFAPPPPVGERDPRVEQVCAAFQNGNLPEKVVYISTTAVYGDCGGAWIDESASLRPLSARGRRRLDAERQLLIWGKRVSVPVVILRVPGIYGPGRFPLDRLRKRLPVLYPGDSPYSNRIHIEDLARICVAAMHRGKGWEIYNVSDGHPTTMTEYFNAVAHHFGLPLPPVVSRDTAEQQLSAAMLSYLSESKRVLNAKMLEDLQIRLDYPDVEAGLAAAGSEHSS